MVQVMRVGPLQFQAKNLVVVMFMTTDGMTHGLTGEFAGLTVAQVRGRISGMGFHVRGSATAFLGGVSIPSSREIGNRLGPGGELWFGWRPSA